MLEPIDRSQDTIGFRARGRINIDARTATAYGMLRTYIRMEMTRNTGAYGFNPTSPEINQALRPVRRPDRRSRGFVLHRSGPAGPELRRSEIRRSFQCRSEPVRLYLLVRQRLLRHPVARGRDPAQRQQRARFSLVRRRIDVPGLCADRLHLCWRAHAGRRREPALHRHLGRSAAVRRAAPDPRRGGRPHDGRRRDRPGAQPDHRPAQSDLRGHGLRFCRCRSRLCQCAVPRRRRYRMDDRQPIRMARSATSMRGQADAISDGFIGAGPLAMPFTDAFVDPFTGEFKTNKAYAIAGGLNHNWTPTIADERLRLLDAFRCSGGRAIRGADDRGDHRRRNGRNDHGPRRLRRVLASAPT